MKQLGWAMAVIVLLIALVAIGQMNVTTTATLIALSSANLTAQLINCILALIVLALLLALPFAVVVGWRWHDGQLTSLDFLRVYKNRTQESVIRVYNPTAHSDAVPTFAPTNLATQRPSSDVVTPRLKGNLSTRIALPVPDRASSMVILDCAGAEKLDKIPGRLLITRNARLVQAHAFDSRQVASSNSLLVKARNPNLATMRPRDYLTTRLTDREVRIARAVVERLDGWFTTEGVMRETEERSAKYINALAHRWHAMGYLSHVLRHERGYNLGRQALPRLRNEEPK